MKKTRRRPTPKAEWEPLHRTTLEDDATPYLAKLAELGVPAPNEVWGSRLYSVLVRYVPREQEGIKASRSGLLHLSVHRRDRRAIRDWRHMQAIKNDVAGPNRVAVEIYPEERNLVDTSNEYHLWVMPAGMTLGFGFQDGGGTATPEENDTDPLWQRTTQRPWQPGITTGRGAL